MFDIGWSELLLIAVVALVVIGPKDLPRAFRTFGQWTGRMKRMAREFQSQFNEALREAELEDVKKEVEGLSKVDPLGEMRRETASIESSLRSEMAGTEAAPPAGTPASVMTPQASPAAPAEPPAAAEPAPPVEAPAASETQR